MRPWPEHFALRQLVARVRDAFAAETVDPRLLWLLAAEGTSAWLRHLDGSLGDHLDDRHRARVLLKAAFAALLVRRSEALPERFGARAVRRPAARRALFEALYPGPLGRSVRWLLDDVSPAPGPLERARALRVVAAMGGEARWLEVSTHLGELAVVLTQQLPAAGVPRAVSWLGDAAFAFGEEMGRLVAVVLALPENTDSAIEALRMGEYLFRVNPEHESASSPDDETGYIEGNACLWYTRPGWGPMHCGVLGRFQAGLAAVFGRRYSLTRTIPKNGGDVCRITLARDPEALARGPELVRITLGSQGNDAWRGPEGLADEATFRADLHAAAHAHSPEAGLFASDSLVRWTTRESVVLLGGGRAALLQLADPAVAAAVRDHSAVFDDLLGRFARTMRTSYGVLFGARDTAVELVERVWHIHRHIVGHLEGDGRGERYEALQARSLFWVGATLIDTTVLMFERAVRPLTAAERDRLVQEAATWWVAFGVPRSECPPTWAAFSSYVRRRYAEMPVSELSRAMAEALFVAPHPWAQPMFDQLRLVTAQLLPAPLRDRYGMSLHGGERLLARGWLFAAERVAPRLPSALRFIPAWHQAERRRAGAPRARAVAFRPPG